MRLYITLDINRIDPEAVKGEEFDEELEDAINEINIDGWEISKLNIQHVKSESKKPITEFAESIVAFATPIEVEGRKTKNQLDEVSHLNEKYTWRELLIFWANEIIKINNKKEK